MRFLIYRGGFLLIAMVLCTCIEPYDPKLNNADLNYLVVDAFLNGSDGTATVKLSRSLPVKSTDPIPAEEGAVVYIEDNNDVIFPLPETAPGLYYGNVDAIPQNLYRLVIRTDDQHEYASGYTPIVETPPIDSLTWSVQRDGIQFEVNTHDPTGASRFYKWRFSETYEYHSKLRSAFMFSPDGVVERPPEELLDYCWRTNDSRSIIVASVKHLQQSVLSRFPVTLITWGSRKLSVRYSLLVQQQSLTEETYDYWLNLQKSTEDLGGLFDPLPSEVSGNISCIHHEGENALGIFSAATISEQRMFLSIDELPLQLRNAFIDRSFCPTDTLLIADLPNVPESTLLVDAVYGLGPEPEGYTIGPPHCIDCRYHGGTTTKPPFWD